MVISKHSDAGFTLIELSIVLIVIGLIIGGILVGRDLIEATRLHSIVAATQDFESRWNVFKLKYNCRPGDCVHATNVFPTAAACPTLSATGTCNGDGDGYITWSTESARVWSHLYFANLAPDYIGWPDPADITNGFYALAPNKKPEVVWVLGSNVVTFAQMYNSVTNDNSGSNMRGVGLQTTRRNSVAGQPRVAVETPSTVRSLDIKMDDGQPAAGKFRASGGRLYDTATLLNCITGSGATAVYDLTQTDVTCRYIYQLEQ